MAHITPNIPVAGRELFTIVKLNHQNYAEIETAFVERHRCVVNSYWKVKKNDIGYHKLKFNNDYDNPLILIQGWNKFKEFHNLPENVEVQMIYHGNKKFEVHAVKEDNSPSQIPPFHSRSRNSTRTTTFDMQLNHFNGDLHNLLLNEDFQAFLSNKNLQSLWLCGDNGQKYFINVLNLTNNRQIELGFNWDSVCNCLNFEEGNRIRFKFEINGNTVSTRCHLFKLY